MHSLGGFRLWEEARESHAFDRAAFVIGNYEVEIELGESEEWDEASEEEEKSESSASLSYWG